MTETHYSGASLLWRSQFRVPQPGIAEKVCAEDMNFGAPPRGRCANGARHAPKEKCRSAACLSDSMLATCCEARPMDARCSGPCGNARKGCHKIASPARYAEESDTNNSILASPHGDRKGTLLQLHGADNASASLTKGAHATRIKGDCAWYSRRGCCATSTALEAERRQM